jgi:hypothetical protein
VKSCVLTIVKNERYFLPIWLNYYKNIFDIKDIYILDNNSNDGSTDDLDVKVEKAYNNISFDHAWLAEKISETVTKLLKAYDCVVFAEVDEILISPNYPLLNLLEIFYKSNHKYLTAKGFHLVQNLNKEIFLEKEFSIYNILNRRNFWKPDGMYDKTLITKIPLKYHVGFHDADLIEKNFQYELTLIHLRNYDLNVCVKRILERTEGFNLEEGSLGFHNKQTSYNFQKEYHENILKDAHIIPEHLKEKLLYNIAI